MDTLAAILLAGYVPMGAAIAVLFRCVMKCYGELLKVSREYEASMVEFKRYLERKGGR